jgi:hypothetical protein
MVNEPMKIYLVNLSLDRFHKDTTTHMVIATPTVNVLHDPLCQIGEYDLIVEELQWKHF